MFPESTDDPVAVFGAWLEEAKSRKDVAEPTAMCLATSTPEGVPSARMVLLKSADARGFVFYTNLESRKGGELTANLNAALCFFWQPLGHQVRVEGVVEPVSAAEADEYFASRARQSRIGAWASKQSRELEGGTKQLLAEAAKIALHYPVGEIPRPPHWSGFRLVPKRIEFREQGDFRLHKRLAFTREGSGWNAERLYP